MVRWHYDEDIPPRPSSSLPPELIVNGNRFDLTSLDGRTTARFYAYVLIASDNDAKMGREILKLVGKEG